jgi:hypothetical protein
MKRTSSILINCAATTFVALMLTACGGGGDSDTGGSGVLSLSITDAPVLNEDIAEVIVCFTHVIVHPSDGSPDIVEDVRNGTDPCREINLKELTNGKTVLLGEFDLAARDYSWIRLDIDPDNTVILEKGKEGDPDFIHEPPRKLDCSSCDVSHLKLNRSFTIDDTGWINFTIDFDLQKSLTLQLPQEAKPRPNYAYKLRPTLRIIDADLATTFIWGSVTDERTPVAVPANPTGCKVYTYEGDMATVTPDDICEAADELDTSCDAVNNQRPLDIALVESVVVDTVETFEYQTGSLYPGTYTVALVCEDDNIEADGDLEFIGEQDVYATLPSGKGPADFVLMD